TAADQDLVVVAGLRPALGGGRLGPGRPSGSLFCALLGLEPGLDRLLVPLAQGADAGLHAHQRVLGGVLFQGGREPRPHRHLGALAHMAEEVLLDGDIGDFLVVERPSDEAKHLGRCIRERHPSLSFGALTPAAWARPRRLRLRAPAQVSTGPGENPYRGREAHIRSHSTADAGTRRHLTRTPGTLNLVQLPYANIGTKFRSVCRPGSPSPSRSSMASTSNPSARRISCLVSM